MDKKNNTGSRNTGSCNTGSCNTGSWNTGSWNTGDRNTGSWNTGSRNTGSRNTGSCNTGSWNTGSWNTGDWNTGDRNTGAFCTDEPNARLFNKDSGKKLSEIDFPSFLYFGTTVWVAESEMSDQEKIDNATFHTTGGYLKEIPYKEAFKKAWDGATEEDKKKLFALPNFDAEIFKEISGIDVYESDKVKIVCEGKTVEISRESAIALNLVKS